MILCRKKSAVAYFFVIGNLHNHLRILLPANRPMFTDYRYAGIDAHQQQLRSIGEASVIQQADGSSLIHAANKIGRDIRYPGL